MLIIVFQSERVLGIDDVIQVGDCLIGEEICGAWNDRVFREVE